jgi:hypothetical protein
MKQIAVAAVAATLVFAAAAPAADQRAPDWPCHQIKVPSLSVAAMWAGPPLDDVAGKWHNDSRTAELVATIAARRTPLDHANELISEFLAGRKDSEQQHKAKLLFAGLFDTLNRERSTVMDAIERFARKRRAFAEQIRSEATELRSLQSNPNPDQTRIEDLTNRISWDIRIYGDQAKAINYVCEVPQTIERRLFALSRTIQQFLD